MRHGIDAPSTTAVSRAEALALAALTLAALALRLADLNRFLLWQDEGATWWYAQLIGEGRLLEGIRLEPTPPLYYLLVSVVTAVLGSSDWAMRFPSAVFGAVSIPALFFLVRSLTRSLGHRTTRLASWASAVLLAVHPLHVFYSREARVYPLLLLLTLLLWLALRRALDDDQTRSWLCVALLLLVIAYSHYYSLFLFATAGLLILLLARNSRSRWRGLVAVALPGLLFLPYVVLTLPHLRQSGAAWSVEALYEIAPGDRSFGRVLEMGMIGADYPVFLREIAYPSTAAWLRWTAIAVQVALLVLAIRRFVAHDADDADDAATRRRDLVFWLVAWLVPLLLPWAITHTFRAIFHLGRHDLYSLWGLVFGVGVGLATLIAAGPGRKMVAALAVSLLLLAATGRLALLHLMAPNLDAQERATLISGVLPDSASDDHQGTTVQIWTLGVRRLLTERYLRLQRPDLDRVPIASFPASIDSHPGWCDADALMEDQDAVLEEAQRRVSGLDPATGLVFVLTQGPPPTADGGLTAQGFLDAALVRALERSSWRLDATLSRRDLDLLAFRRPGS